MTTSDHLTTLGEPSAAVHQALCMRVRSQRLDLITTYGIEPVMQAIEDKAVNLASSRLEEIGTSDVSCWVKEIEKSLSLQLQTSLASAD